MEAAKEAARRHSLDSMDGLEELGSGNGDGPDSGGFNFDEEVYQDSESDIELAGKSDDDEDDMSSNESIESLTDNIERGNNAIHRIHRRMTSMGSLARRKTRRETVKSLESLVQFSETVNKALVTPETAAKRRGTRMAARKDATAEDKAGALPHFNENEERARKGASPIRRRLTAQAVRQDKKANSLLHVLRGKRTSTKVGFAGDKPSPSHSRSSSFGFASSIPQLANQATVRFETEDGEKSKADPSENTNVKAGQQTIKSTSGSSARTAAARRRFTQKLTQVNNSVSIAKQTFQENNIDVSKDDDKDKLFAPLAIPSMGAGTILFVQRAAVDGSTQEEETAQSAES